MSGLFVKKWLVFWGGFFLCWELMQVPCCLSADRGVVYVKTHDGKSIPLYDNSYALVVGNGHYTEGWGPLPGALADVDEVAKALRANGFTVELKKDLTEPEFKTVFGDFVDRYGSGKGNRLLFYYAGHGFTEKKADNEDLGYLVMVDAPDPVKSRAKFRRKSITMDYLVTQSTLIQSKHVLFMFDSCFSGTILNMRDRLTPESISDSVRYPVREFITAGRAEESVPDQSIFKQAFLDLLEGRDKEPFADGYLTGEELGFYLKHTVPSYYQGQHPQFGKIRNIKLDKGDFIFVLKPGQAPIPQPQQEEKYWREPITGMKFVQVPGGCFDMGQTPAEKEQLMREEGEDDYKKYFADELPRHRVCVDGFRMGQYEVTVGQFRQFVDATGYQTDAERNAGGVDGCYVFKDNQWGYQKGYSWQQVGFSQEEDYPVACVSWNDAQKFIGWLNGKAGRTFRLPTEAEWEYAARGGSQTIRYWGDAVDSTACRYANAGDQGHWTGAVFPCNDSYKFAAPVGKFKANDFDLYDMLGNVWEWCQDWYGEDYYRTSSGNNPQGPSSGGSRVDRGGGWGRRPGGVRAADRDGSYGRWSQQQHGLPACPSPRSVKQGRQAEHGDESVRPAWTVAEQVSRPADFATVRSVFF